MRRFETIYITDPEVSDEQAAVLIETFSGTVTQGKGEVLRSEDWGKKRLAYEVRKHTEGRYIVLEYACEDSSLPQELERRLRMNEQVIKFLTIRIDDDRHRLAWEEKQAERERARAERLAAQDSDDDSSVSGDQSSVVVDDKADDKADDEEDNG